MSSVECLREFVNERLTAAAEEIFGVFKRTIAEYEDEIERQRKLLNIVWKPEIKLHRIEVPQQHVCKEEEEEVLDGQQLCDQERNSSLDQEEPESPQIKEEEEELCTSHEEEQFVLRQETDSFMLTPTKEESDPESNTDHHLISINSRVPVRQDWREDELENSRSTRSPQCDHSGDQNLDLSPDKSRNTEIQLPAMYISWIKTESNHEKTEVSEPNRHQQLLFDNFDVAESQDHKEGRHGDLGSTTNADPKPEKRRCKSSQKSVKCDTCQKEFKFESELRRHRRRHTGEKPHSCSLCGRRFSRKSQMKIHVRIHTGEKPYTCSTCGKCFRRKSEVNTHSRIHTGEKPHSCKICQKDFRSQCELKTHVRKHTHEKPYLCETCGKRFSFKSTCRRHMKSHTGEKPHSCETCGKEFQFSYDLKVHLRVHTGERPCICKTCGRGFKYSHNLLSHRRIHADKNLENVGELSDLAVPEEST